MTESKEWLRDWQKAIRSPEGILLLTVIDQKKKVKAKNWGVRREMAEEPKRKIIVDMVDEKEDMGLGNCEGCGENPITKVIFFEDAFLNEKGEVEDTDIVFTVELCASCFESLKEFMRKLE